MVGCLMLVFVLRLNVIWVVPCIFVCAEYISHG